MIDEMKMDVQEALETAENAVEKEEEAIEAVVEKEEEAVEAVVEREEAVAEAVVEKEAAVEVVESMDDYAEELEATLREYQNRSTAYVAEEDPKAELWQTLCQMKDDKTIVKVKIKEVVKGGVITLLEDMRAFIPASQISIAYVEKLEDWIGKYVDAFIITVDPEKKKLVLSGKEVEKERKEAERAEKMAQCKVGAVVEGTVDSIKPYGAFMNLENGLSGLLHISQISNQRIKHPNAVLKEGDKLTVKIISMADGKISLSKKALESEDVRDNGPVFDYKETGTISTGLGSLLAGLKF